MAQRKKDEEAVSRRAVLGRAAAALAVLTTAGAAAGCKKKALMCDGPSVTDGVLTAEEVQLRKMLLYTDLAQTPDKACINCTLFVAAREADTCATCKVIHGPVHPNGTCKIFLRKPEGGAPT
jgi:hypothetical protein